MKTPARTSRVRKTLAALLPAALGVGLALYTSLLAPYDPILYLRADLATLALILGIGGSLVAGLVWWVLYRINRRSTLEASRLSAASADERRRFLRRLDHELKNPLTAIRAGLANLAESPTAETRQEALASTEAQALRLSRLSADLRKLAELEVRLVEHTPVDITALLQEAYTLAQDTPAASQRRLSLSIPQAPWPLPKITGDPDLLFLAVHNLLENALKYTCAGATIELRAFEDGASIVIEVADTGPGISAEEQPHVWEELYRGEAGRGTPGSGLGLALVRAIAERHNGQAHLRSRAGQGTVFSLRLPVG